MPGRGAFSFFLQQKRTSSSGAEFCSCLVTASQCGGKGGEVRVGQSLEADRSGFKSCSALGHSVLLPLWADVFSSVQWRLALLPC